MIKGSVWHSLFLLLLQSFIHKCSSSNTRWLPWTHFSVSNAICTLFQQSMKDGDHTQIELVSPPCDPIATPQASSVPHEEPLYDAIVTQDQRVPYMMGPAGNVPTSSVQEAQYS